MVAIGGGRHRQDTVCDAVRPWVPDSIYRKPKMGFGPPDASWYRGQLAIGLRAN